MKQVIFVFCLVFCQVAEAQVKKKDLIGLWTICNDNDAYYKADTLKLYQDINYQLVEKKSCCHFINWRIASKKLISIETVFTCSEPGRIIKGNSKEKIKLSGSKQNQFLGIERDGVLVDRFKIIKYEQPRLSRYPYETKVLVLKREVLIRSKGAR